MQRLIDVNQKIEKIKNFNIYSVVESYSKYNKETWNPLEFLPNHTTALQVDSSYRLICLSLAKANLDDFFSLYEVRELDEVYRLYTDLLAQDYRPPKNN